MKKTVVIVGGVAGGANAAARARRLSEDSDIIVIERDHVSFANCGLPYHIGAKSLIVENFWCIRQNHFARASISMSVFAPKLANQARKTDRRRA